MGMVEEITSYLSTQCSLTLGTNLFANTLPETSGNVVSVGVFESQGFPAVQRFGSNLPAWEQPRIDILVRSTHAPGGAPSSTAARQKAFDAWEALIKVKNQSLPTSTGTNSYYLHIEPSHSPYLMDRDAKGRYIFAFSADVMRVVSTAG